MLHDQEKSLKVASYSFYQEQSLRNQLATPRPCEQQLINFFLAR